MRSFLFFGVLQPPIPDTLTNIDRSIEERGLPFNAQNIIQEDEYKISDHQKMLFGSP